MDWERKGKAERQALAEARIGTDTQIGADTAEDLARVVAAHPGPVICRINAVGPHSAGEVERAARLGATEVLVPMVRRVDEVEAVLRVAGGTVGVGVMVETVDAVERAAQLARLPITRAYVGLMDLALDRGSSSIFDAVVDGTLERVRTQMDVPFGFGGLTVPGGGDPVPTALLLGEMARLGCGFTFLRRTFIADIDARRIDAGEGVRAIRRAATLAAARTDADVRDDRRRLVECIAPLDEARRAPT